MSFLADVLTSVHQISVIDVNKRVPKLKQRIQELKKDVLTYIEEVYVKCTQSPTKMERFLLNKYPGIEDEIRSLNQSAGFAVRKDIRRTISDLDNHLETLDQMATDLCAANRFISINDKLMDFGDLMDRQEYLACAELIEQLENNINDISDGYQQVNIMVDNIDDCKRTLNTALKEMIRENIVVKECNENSYVLTVPNDSTNLQKALLALFYNKNSDNLLENVKNLLWNNFFCPILQNTVEIELNQTYTTNTFRVNVVSTQKVANYKQAFENLGILVNFLNDKLCFKLNEELTTLAYFSDSMQDDLIQLLIEHCSNEIDLEAYKVMMAEVGKLENTLKLCKMFDKGTSLVELVESFEIQSINRKRRQYISESRELMKEMNISNCEYNEKLQCCVSTNVVKLLEYCEKILQEAVCESDANASKLVCIVKSIITMYGQFLPEYHRKMLQVVPRQVAVFNNNCRHIGSVLTELNERFCHKQLKICCIFEIELHQIQMISSRIFSTTVKNEIKLINDILSELKFDKMSSTDILSIIQKCLKHHEYLKSEWHDVLPYTKYTHIMGKILDSFITSFVSSIVAQEDISSDTVDVLIEALRMIETHAEKLFKTPEDVASYLPSWSRLCELIHILGTNLLNIMNRWNDDKGPLAKQYNSDEVKSLVRAIFPESQERATVLMKIA